MGANVSKSSQKVLMDASTKIVTQVLTNFKNSQTNNINAYQITYVEIGKGAVVKCTGDLKMRQVNNVIFSALMNASAQDKTNISNEITKELTAKISSLISQENSGINFGQANVNWSDSEIQQKVATVVNTSVSTTIENSLVNNLNNKQGQFFIIGEGAYVEGGNCDFSQDATTALMSQMITQNIAENLISNVDKSILSGDSQMEVKQTNAGLNWPWIGGGIFGVIGFCIFAFIIFKVMKKKTG